MRYFDWSASDLGPPGRWPENLRTAVSLCLTSRFPILIWWGPDLNVLYNDAYIPFLGGAKHPCSLGRPGRDVWAELWDTIGPMLEGVRRTGAATWSDDFLCFIERDLPREEVHVRFTYGPILAADGRTVEGVFCPCTEITDEVVGTRRLETLRELGVKCPGSRSVRAACAEAARVLSGDPHDIPFAAIYAVDEACDGVRLVASAGLPEDHPLPPRASLAAGDATPWPLASVLRSEKAEEVRELRWLAGPLPGSPWPEPPSRAVVLPVPAPNHGGLAGLLALGVSPRRVWDGPYRSFFELVAGQIGTALADAAAYEAERRRAEALADSEGRLAAELTVMERLQELSTRLVKHGDGDGLLPQIVDAAIGITAADMGNVQLYDGASDSLRIVASRGFRPEDLDLFAVIRRGESTCGTSLERGERVVVGDVTASAIFAGKPLLDAILAAGIRALQSTPLISRSGRLVGMLSTHFRSPRFPAERDLRILDLVARQAADWIERTQAEVALRESEARFRIMADHAPVMIWVTDPAGICSYVNERWCQFTGTPPEEGFGLGWLDSVHPDDRERAGSDFRSATARNETFRAEYRLRRHDGAYRWVIDSAAPRFAPDGAYLGYIGSVLDVTNEKRAEEEIRRARDEMDLSVRERTAELTEALATLGRQEEVRKELLRRVVTVQEDERRRISRELHDQMGQQLTALMLRLRLAKDSAGEDSPLQEHLRWLEDHAARISRDVHHVALKLRPTALDDLGLPEALAQYADEWTRRAGVAAELRVNGLWEERLPPLIETTIYRAVQEAMTNVLKHAGATRVVVILSRLKDSVSVSVEDDGKGFDGEGAMESDSGARLGLLGIKERVAFARGTLAIESSPGAGTSVLIRIPTRSSEEGPR